MVIYRRHSPTSRHSNKIREGNRAPQSSSSSLLGQLSPSSIAENIAFLEFGKYTSGGTDEDNDDDKEASSIAGTDAYSRHSLTSVD
jgi:hypothetical protein